jgi:hypothetical protein
MTLSLVGSDLSHLLGNARVARIWQPPVVQGEEQDTLTRYGNRVAERRFSGTLSLDEPVRDPAFPSCCLCYWVDYLGARQQSSNALPGA